MDILKNLGGLSMLFSLKLLMDVSKAKNYEDFRKIVFNALKLCTNSQYWHKGPKNYQKTIFFTNLYFMFSVRYHNKAPFLIIGELNM